MNEIELCGWLISGDPGRPCALETGHPTGRKGRAHRDAEYLEKQRTYNRAYSAENYVPSPREYTTEVADRRAYLEAHKLAKGCAECGYCRAPQALQMDHLDPLDKTTELGAMVRNPGRYSWDDFLAEIAKCQVLCANCHIEKTVREGDYTTGRART